MLDFKKIELADREWVEPLLKAADLDSCTYSFGNMYIWQDVYYTRLARVNDYGVVKTGIENDRIYYFFPFGHGDIKPVLEAMMEDAKENGSNFVLAGILPQQQAVLEALWPDRFRFVEVRDDWDYIYSLDKLITLSGKKLHGKRNHIARFKDGDDWSYEEMTMENIDECWGMNINWCQVNGCGSDPSLAKEACAVRNAFVNFSVLGLEGGVLRKGGRVVAFTVGEPLNSNTFVTHIEKAFGDVQGAYPMINQQFAMQIKAKHPEMMFVNREEDTGDEGLRRAKLSYGPEKMAERNIARLKA
ncbi:MAG: DUF2156 domain-containing protein [Oscillospiraceae bacterium]|nr:DUF2156 domain-containing protein [Oscillospiraceae bacterium]